MGGFILTLGIQRWNPHRRLALHAILLVGTTPEQLIGGFMIATALASMWVSTTATAATFLPIMGGVASGTGLADHREQNVLLPVLPVDTPPNAIAFAPGYSRIVDMIVGASGSTSSRFYWLRSPPTSLPSPSSVWSFHKRTVHRWLTSGFVRKLRPV
nr:SLC13 family permease [Corynebacterium pacaense]